MPSGPTWPRRRRPRPPAEGATDTKLTASRALTPTTALLLSADDRDQSGAETAGQQRAEGSRQRDSSPTASGGSRPSPSVAAASRTPYPAIAADSTLRVSRNRSSGRASSGPRRCGGSGQPSDQEAADQHRPVEPAGRIAQRTAARCRLRIRAAGEHGRRQITGQTRWVGASITLSRPSPLVRRHAASHASIPV